MVASLMRTVDEAGRAGVRSLLGRLSVAKVLLLACVLSAGAPTSAPAQAIDWDRTVSPIPPVAPGQMRFTSRLVGSQLELREVATGRAIIAAQGHTMTPWFPAGVTSRIALQDQPSGVDVIFTIRNVTSEPKRMGRLSFHAINLGQEIEYFDFRKYSTPVRAVANNFVGQAWPYPSDMYSPVAVLRNQDYAVGLSIHYPVIVYEHDVRVGVASPPGQLAQGEAGRAWIVEFGLSNIGQEAAGTQLHFPGMLQPDEERTYVVAIRVSTPDRWQETLLPYRDYFRSMYGGVRYQRQTTPLNTWGTGDLSWQSPTNPYAFRPEMRPDGPGGYRRQVDNAIRYGWDTVLVTAPTGFYNNVLDLNYPFQFASRWLDDPALASALDPSIGFPRIPAAGKQLGLWWGRSLQVARTWNPDSMEDFNPDDPEHVALALRELDAAAQTGATLIGLDTFNHIHTPIWRSIPWLERMETRYPQMTFVTEPSSNDILHTLAPTWVHGYRDFTSRPASRDDFFTIRHPNYLADFLLPGHEMWASFGYHDYTRLWGAVTAQSVAEDVARYANLGYRPVWFTPFPQPQGVAAAQTWEQTIPQDIRDNDPHIVNLRAGRLPLQSAPQGNAAPVSGGNSEPSGSGGSGGSGDSGEQPAGGSGAGSGAGSGSGSGPGSGPGSAGTPPESATGGAGSSSAGSSGTSGPGTSGATPPPTGGGSGGAPVVPPSVPSGGGWEEPSPAPLAPGAGVVIPVGSAPGSTQLVTGNRPRSWWSRLGPRSVRATPQRVVTQQPEPQPSTGNNAGAPSTPSGGNTSNASASSGSTGTIIPAPRPTFRVLPRTGIMRQVDRARQREESQGNR